MAVLDVTPVMGKWLLDVFFRAEPQPVELWAGLSSTPVGAMSLRELELGEPVDTPQYRRVKIFPTSWNVLGVDDQDRPGIRVDMLSFVNASEDQRTAGLMTIFLSDKEFSGMNGRLVAQADLQGAPRILGPGDTMEISFTLRF